jgi:hypothetical protein
MRVRYYRSRADTQARPFAQSGEGEAVAHYNPKDGALMTARDQKSGREVWVHLDPVEVEKLVRIYRQNHDAPAFVVPSAEELGFDMSKFEITSPDKRTLYNSEATAMAFCGLAVSWAHGRKPGVDFGVTHQGSPNTFVIIVRDSRTKEQLGWLFDGEYMRA